MYPCPASIYFPGAREKRPRKPDLCSVRANRRHAVLTALMTDPSSSITRCPQPGMPSPGCRAAGAGATVARARAARATVPPSRYPARDRPVPGSVRFSGRGGHRHVPVRGSEPGARPGPVPDRSDLTGRAESRVDACGPGREASPPHRPAAGRAVPPVTARDPAPGPAGLPLRQDRAARQHPPRLAACPQHGPRSGPGFFSCSPGRQPRPGDRCGGRT